VPETAANHEQDRPNRRNRLLRAKNGLLPSPVTNRRRVGDASAWVKRRAPTGNQCGSYFGSSLCFIWGRCPQTSGIYRFGATMARLHIGRYQHPASRWSALEPQQMTVRGGTGCTRPTIAAAESALRSHPCVALSSAQLQSVSPNDISPSRNIQ